MGKRKSDQAETPAKNDRLSIRLDLASGARIGPGKVAVLEEIARSGSISAAGSSSATEPIYPYCTSSGDENRCDFTSYEQCLATASGIGLECIVNPIIAFQRAQQLQQPAPSPRRQHARKSYSSPYN